MRRMSARRRVLWLMVVLVLLSAAPVLALRWVNPPLTAVMVERLAAARLAGSPDFRLHHRWVPWDEISPYMRLAVVASEDQTFPYNWGFDFSSIRKALQEHEEGERLRGASTITQQVARNLFLWTGRSWVRKGIEAYITVLLEALWPKQRILEVYLNIVELGDGVFGVEAAAERDFGVSAATLNARQAALLAAVLPNPLHLHVRHPSEYVLQRRAWILRQMKQLGGVAYLKGL